MDIQQLGRDPTAIKKCSTPQMKSVLKQLDDEYYNNGKSLISDESYDYIKSWIINIIPTCNTIGAPSTYGVKATLPYYMGSADKISNAAWDKKFRLWRHKNPGEKVLISEKIDGVSALVQYINGSVKMYTRGNGTVGTDISHLVKLVKGIPTLDQNMCVRGELVVRNAAFLKYKNEYKLPRGMVCGIIGHKTIYKKKLACIEFVAFEIINPVLDKPSIQFSNLVTHGFNIPQFLLTRVPTALKTMLTYHTTMKNQAVYEIDGLIVQIDNQVKRNTLRNPYYMFAFKVNDQGTHTVVTAIKWHAGRYAALCPVATIQARLIDNTVVQHVSCSNASLLYFRKIMVGSNVWVIKSNGVIPYITTVVNDQKFVKCKPQQSCSWDATRTQLVLDVLTPEVYIKRICFFFATLGIKYLGESTVTTLYNHGYTTPDDIISVTANDLIQSGVFKKKTAERIMLNITNGLKNLSVEKLICATSVYGKGIGLRKITALFKALPIYTMKRADFTIQDIVNIDGFYTKTATVIAGKHDKMLVLVDLFKPFISIKPRELKTDGKYKGNVYCFSGFRDQDLVQKIESLGGQVAKSLTKKVTHLVMKNISKTTGKYKKAMENNCIVLTKDDLIV